MAKHPRFFGGWSVWLRSVLPLYYRLAGGMVYRGIKKGLGR